MRQWGRSRRERERSASYLEKAPFQRQELRRAVFGPEGSSRDDLPSTTSFLPLLVPFQVLVHWLFQSSHPSVLFPIFRWRLFSPHPDFRLSQSTPWIEHDTRSITRWRLTSSGEDRLLSSSLTSSRRRALIYATSAPSSAVLQRPRGPDQQRCALAQLCPYAPRHNVCVHFHTCHVSKLLSFVAVPPRSKSAAAARSRSCALILSRQRALSRHVSAALRSRQHKSSYVQRPRGRDQPLPRAPAAVECPRHYDVSTDISKLQRPRESTTTR